MIQQSPLRASKRTTAVPLCVVGYHELALRASRDVYEVTPTMLAEHLHLLRTGAAAAHREVRITFDDGHRSQIDLAAPLLENLGLRGWFFVPAEWVGCRRETADWSELRRLLDAGHRVGSHGHTHALLTLCTPEALRWELVRSRETLEERLGCEVRTISLPGGRGSAAVIAACQAAGYHEVYTSDPCTHSRVPPTAEGEAMAVRGRLVVRRTTLPSTLKGYGSHDPVTMALLGLGHRTKNTLKGLLGDIAYQRVWRRLLRAPAEDIVYMER